MRFATFSKVLVASAAGAMTLAGAAMAQEAVEAKKETVAPLQNLLPNSYGSLELRHETDQYMTDDQVDNTVPNVSLRPKLGSKFFDGKLNAYLVWIFEKKADTNTVNKTLLYSENYFDVFSNDYVYLTFYGYGEQNAKSDLNNVQVGPIIGNGQSLELGAVKLSTDVYNLFTPIFQPNGSRGTSPVRADTVTPGLGLTANEQGDYEIDQRDPSLYNETGATVTLKPAALEAFSTTLGVISWAVYNPKYEAKVVDGDERYDQDGYAVSRSTMSLFNLGYKLSDSVKLGNSFRHYTSGFYEAGIHDNSATRNKRWENRLSVTTTLF